MVIDMTEKNKLQEAREFAKEKNLPNLSGSSQSEIDLGETARFYVMNKQYNQIRSLEMTKRADDEHNRKYPQLPKRDQDIEPLIVELMEGIKEISAITDSIYWVRRQSEDEIRLKMVSLRSSIKNLKEQIDYYPERKDELEPLLKAKEEEYKGVVEMFKSMSPYYESDEDNGSAS